MPKVKGSNRQIGDRPKVMKTYRLDADLVDLVERRAKEESSSQVQVVESALLKYLINETKDNESSNGCDRF